MLNPAGHCDCLIVVIGFHGGHSSFTVWEGWVGIGFLLCQEVCVLPMDASK